MKTKLLYFVIAFGCSTLNAAYSQQGRADATFNTYDDGFSGDGFDGNVRTVTLQSDGKLIVGGEFVNFIGASTPKFCRLLPDGSKDPSFITGSSFNGNVYCSLVLPNGKIIVGGTFSKYNGNTAYNIIRLNSDGSYDSSFNTFTMANSNIIYSIALHSDGSYIVVGSFTKYNNVTVNRIAKIFPNGNLDTTFATGVGADALVEDVQVQSDGKIIIGGKFTNFNGIACHGIIRLNPSGSTDSSFIMGEGFDNDVRTIAIQTDGKILVGGDFIDYNNTTANRIVRLNTDGSIDVTFASGSGFSSGSVSVIKVTALGKIMVGGSFSALYNGTDVNRLLLLDANGSRVPTFDIGDGPASATVLALAIDSDLSWFIGGSFSVFDSQNQGKLAKIDADGTLDIGYLAAGVGFDNSVLKVISLPDNKTMAFGNFTKFNGSNVVRITRLSDDGKVDLSFNSTAIGANNVIRTAALQADGNVVFAGNFTSYNGVLINRICRILPNGAIDPTFLIGTGFSTQVYCLAVQADGKIIVGGNFIKYNGTTVNGIARLLTDGSIDTSFITSTGFDGIVEAITIQTDGKILIGGRFVNFNGTAHGKLVRLNTDGSVDSGFNIGAGFDKNVYAIAMQSDNKIIVGGTFVNFNGTSAKRLLRLNANGSLDNTFTTGTGFSKGEVRAILVQPDNRLLVGGTFNGTYNGKPVLRMVRLLPDAVYDSTFSVDLNATLFSMCLTSDARLIIGGNFNSVSGVAKHRIARLKLCTDSSTWNGSSWSNASPSLGKALTFNGDFDIDTNVNSCSCTIATGKTVTVKTGNTLGLSFEYSGLGTLVLENNASLYQYDDDIVNTGLLKIKRETTPIVKMDYTYWSSPVSNQKLIDVSPNTLSDKYFSFNSDSNSWFTESPSNTMTIGKGYIIRGPQEYSTTVPAKYEAVFSGVPNNGKVSIPIGGNNTSNLVGNPYPSAINADLFLTKNKDFIDGTIYFWTHNTPITNNVYTSNDYAVYNLLGGVATQAALNSGVNNTKPDGKIASGQAFFTTSIKDGGTANFDDSMRLVGQNTTFFRLKNNNKTKSVGIEKHRVWLNLSNSQGAFKQILVGYTTNASNDYDTAFDGESINRNDFVNFYSINHDKNLVIQGRALPFDEVDTLPLGYQSKIEGVFSISIDELDGLFGTHGIYIEDKLFNIVHDLKRTSYSFTTQKGTFNDRFVLRYTDRTLGTKDFTPLSNELIISKDKNELKIKSELETIKIVTVYDLLGRKLFEKNVDNGNEFRSSTIRLTKQIVVVKVTLTNGKVISKKVPF